MPNTPLQTAPVLIYEDNQPTIKLVKNPVCHKKSKHVEIKYHFELVENRTIHVQYVSTVENVADNFTKHLSLKEFTTLRVAFLSFVI